MLRLHFDFVSTPITAYTETKRRWHLPFVEFCSMFEGGVGYHSFVSMFQRIGDFFYDVNKCLSANTIVWVFHQKTKILLSFRLVDVYTHYQKIVERVKGEIVIKVLYLRGRL